MEEGALPLNRAALPLADWYVIGQSADFGAQPERREILSLPIVLYRHDGRVVAFLDRCPHRNVPLSAGRCDPAGTLSCPYHGWRFDPDGRCVEVPGRTEQEEMKVGLSALALCEVQGLVFVCPRVGVTPERPPKTTSLSGEEDYTTVIREVTAPAGLHAVAENALDVPHTAIVHRGLFRGTGERHRVRGIIRRYREWIECEYQGEPPPRGLAARLLAVGQGGTVEHFDRFFLPGVLQVEYRLGASTHFLITAYLTPVREDLTRLTAVANFKTPLPGWLLALLLEPLARWVFRQDQQILAQQADNLRRFGGPKYASTELDTLGPGVLRLLRQAEKREADGLESLTDSAPPRSKDGEEEKPVQVHEVELLV